MKGFLAAFEAAIAVALAVVAVHRLSNPIPVGQKALTVKLVLASRDIEPGTILRDGDVVLADWPAQAPTNAFSHTQDVVGRGVTAKIYAKEAILASRLAPKGAGGGLAAMIPPGMRAVAVPVNDAVDVAGFALPAMHVDVIISGTPPSGTGGLGTRTRTLLQNIEVLSAGRYFENGAEGKPVAVQVVNLLVTSEQAEQLSLASHKTAIQLVMHNLFNRKVPPSPADVPPPMPANKWVRPVMDDVPPPPPPVIGNRAWY